MQSVKTTSSPNSTNAALAAGVVSEIADQYEGLGLKNFIRKIKNERLKNLNS